MTTLDPEPNADCLRRTRSTVLNLLVVAGLLIAGSGLVLRRSERGATLWRPQPARRVALTGLVGLAALSTVCRIVGASRTRLKHPATRARRFYGAHVGAALFGVLAVPVGFAYGYAIQPRLEAVLPFWAIALALGFLALPRPEALDGFDQPIPPTPGPTTP
jgi:hypothetical protein